MANDIQLDDRPTVKDLVSGIVQDAQNLINQQLTLFRRELQAEVRRVIRAAISLGVGAGVIALGGIILVFMLVHLLNYLTGMHLWACHAIVGGLLVLIGGLLLYLGRRGVSEVHLIPPPQTTEALKENIEWLKNQTTSNPA